MRFTVRPLLTVKRKNTSVHLAVVGDEAELGSEEAAAWFQVGWGWLLSSAYILQTMST